MPSAQILSPPFGGVHLISMKLPWQRRRRQDPLVSDLLQSLNGTRPLNGMSPAEAANFLYDHYRNLAVIGEQPDYIRQAARVRPVEGSNPSQPLAMNLIQLHLLVDAYLQLDADMSAGLGGHSSTPRDPVTALEHPDLRNRGILTAYMRVFTEAQHVHKTLPDKTTVKRVPTKSATVLLDRSNSRARWLNDKQVTTNLKQVGCLTPLTQPQLADLFTDTPQLQGLKMLAVGAAALGTFGTAAAAAVIPHNEPVQFESNAPQQERPLWAPTLPYRDADPASGPDVEVVKLSTRGVGGVDAQINLEDGKPPTLIVYPSGTSGHYPEYMEEISVLSLREGTLVSAPINSARGSSPTSPGTELQLPCHEGPLALVFSGDYAQATTPVFQLDQVNGTCTVMLPQIGGELPR